MIHLSFARISSRVFLFDLLDVSRHYRSCFAYWKAKCDFHKANFANFVLPSIICLFFHISAANSYKSLANYPQPWITIVRKCAFSICWERPLLIGDFRCINFVTHKYFWFSSCIYLTKLAYLSIVGFNG